MASAPVMKHSMFRPVVVALVLLAAVTAWARDPLALNQAASVAQRQLQEVKLRDLPKECLQTGMQFQSSCGSEIQQASKFFGVPSNAAGLSAAASKINAADLDAYLARADIKPSDGCCKAATSFNANACNCNSKVLEFAKTFTGGDEAAYGKMIVAFSRNCNFSLKYGATC